MAVFNFPNNSLPANNERITFKISQLNDLLINEAKQLSQTGIYSVVSLINKVRSKSNQSPEFSDTSLPNSSNTFNFQSVPANTKAYFGNRIINISLLPTNYINSFNQIAQTPRVDLDLCYIDIDFENELVVTPLINQQGTVKEVVSQSDFRMTIQGALLGFFTPPTPDNPLQGKDTQTMKDLMTIASSKVAVNVASDYLNLFNVSQIVIQNITFPQENKFWNVQNFAITALSDSPDLYIL